ncbi:LOW QUALITY PROTEIN: hypothetical protein CVT26_008433 [Gymnopilus dilepis]|uniref:Uncharacterized protein n=1 Tax=Gymnopilus dilepis TaxID=231916 RepID=A0A409YRV9_9AGAR|nr:LOW QUALITY PROTEIN: hypothetical protein CVT26_008433 [Gymnopilus dilepis]
MQLKPQVWGHGEGERSELPLESIREGTRQAHGGDPPTLGTPQPEVSWVAEATSLHDADGQRRSYQPAASDPQTSFTLRPHPLGDQQQPLPRSCPPAFASRKKLLTPPDVFTTENQIELIPGKPLRGG